MSKAKSVKQIIDSLGGKPLRKDVIVTLETEESSGSGLILSATEIKGSSKSGMLKEEQTVLAIGPYCDNVSPGDKVIIDFRRYLKEEGPKRLSGDHQKKVMWDIPYIVIDDVIYGRITESDIIWIFDDKGA